ncbi:MAG: SOS response-associated peptidase [Pseudomonadota bacterium]
MCGRYQLNATPREIANFCRVDVRDNFPARYNIAPTQPIATIRMSEVRDREYALARWGFIPSWAKKDYHERMGSKPLINARAETAAEKPTFRSAFKRRRCLIPANGYYEWRKEGDGKQPYCIRFEDAALFAFAGIWETAHDPDGGEIDTAAILTISAGEDTSEVHHREPVVIAPEDFDLWLTADERDLRELSRMLAPAEGWTFFPVSKAVNSPRSDGPELIEPLVA